MRSWPLALLCACTSPASTGGGTTGGGSSSSTDSSSSSSSDSSGSGTGFIAGSDMGGPPIECSLFAQDCPRGEKCMPWASDGGNAWNATRCFPVAPDPAAAGEPCTVEGSGVSGMDDCEEGAVCWLVDPISDIGACVPTCLGSMDDAYCLDPRYGCTGDGALSICVPHCDPVGQDCAAFGFAPGGAACIPLTDRFSCFFAGQRGPGEPCQFLNQCAAGLFCAEPATVPGCENESGCCSEFCDLADPACTDPGQACLPWFADGQVPVGLGHVGACALPPR